MLLLSLATLTRNKDAERLDKARKILDRIVQVPADIVPDAVLNRARCLVVFPAEHDRRAQMSVHGVVNCRDASGQWDSPSGVTLTDGEVPENSDLLVFLFTDSAVNALRSGQLRLRSGAGPMERTQPASTEKFGYSVAYVKTHDQVSGSTFEGTIRLDTGQQASARKTKAYRASLISFFNTITPTGIILHHTSVIPTEGKLPASERDLDEYHKERGFDVMCFGKEYHAAYHYLILPDGKVQKGRPDRCEGAHAPGYNSYLGISVVGDFSSADNPTGAKGPVNPTPQQIKSIIELCRRLREEYNIPVQHILRHSDVAPTLCPGDRFPFRYILSQVAPAG